MAKDVTIQGATYSDVPSVELPKAGGGTASFIDVTDTTAVASDVSVGKYFYLADGTRVQGTDTDEGGGVPSISQDQEGYLVLNDEPGEELTLGTLTVTDKNSTFAYMPYSWHTTNLSTNVNYSRVATIVVTHGSADSVISIEFNNRLDHMSTTLYARFESVDSTDPNLVELSFNDASGTYHGMVDAFAYKTTTSTWDVYIKKNSGYDQISVRVFVPEHLQHRCYITFADAERDTIPSGAVMASSSMPFSATVVGISGNDGYARIARVKINSYGTTSADQLIEFKIIRRRDITPYRLTLRLNTENNLPAIYGLWYDSGTTNATFEAFAYKYDTTTIDVYVNKTVAYDEIGVWTYMSTYMKYRCTVEYGNELRTNYPSGSVFAKPAGFDGNYTATYAPILRFSIPANTTKRISGTNNGECAWLLSCTGWSSSIRSGLYHIAGYSDSSRADVTAIKAATGITITAVSGQLAWDISNTQTVSALIGLTSLYGAMPTVS